MDDSTLDEIPLFPLNTVLFPGGPLSLRIFEPRYLDMISDCMKRDRGFGVVLISAGEETGRSHFHAQGTLARICDWDRLEDGLLGITAIGEQCFQLEQVRQARDGLNLGKVRWIELPEPSPLPGAYKHLAEILKQLIPQLPRPWQWVEPDYDDAFWVAHRLAEVLPISLRDKQQLLESDDPDWLLAQVNRYVEPEIQGRN